MSKPPAPNATGLFDGAPARIALWLLLAIGGATAVVAGGSIWFGHSITLGGHTDDPTIREIVIGNDVLRVPSNAIRFERARRDGDAARLDLYFAWPSMEGFSDARRDIFNGLGGKPALVFVSIEERVMSRDMSGRYDLIYGPLTVPTDRGAGTGLEVRDFTQQSGYSNEELVVRNGSPFLVARCLTGDAADASSAPCERDIQIGRGLSASYRFPKALLPEWEALETGVRNRLQEFLIEPAGS